MNQEEIKKTISKLQAGKIPTDYNWNKPTHKSYSYKNFFPEPRMEKIRNVSIVSEDLRDGLHGIENYPTLKDMINHIKILRKLGIKDTTVGIYPGEEANGIDKNIKRLLTLMSKETPDVTPILLSLATEKSIMWLKECKKLNKKVTAIVFIGTAPSRMLVEEWKQEELLNKLGWAVNKVSKELKIDVIGATEHTTQTPPTFLKKLIEVQVKNGAKYFCVADTIGVARPIGAFNIIKFTKKVLKDIGKAGIQVDWHGHEDMSNGVSNAMAALAAGADRVHVVTRGVGERAGNTSLEGVLLNLQAIAEDNEDRVKWDLSYLYKVLKSYDKIIDMPEPSHGALGKRSHTTSLGIHTAAILKAENLAYAARLQGHITLADNLDKMSRRIYSSVDPITVGKNHDVRVSHWSGKSSVVLAYRVQGGNPDKITDEAIDNVLSTAKKLERQLTREEIEKIIGKYLS